MLEWPLNEIKRYGLEEEVCSVEAGHCSQHPGVLHFDAGRDRSTLLFRGKYDAGYAE